MAFELKGTVKLVQDPQTFNKGFTKREFVVVVDDGKYPQEIALECVQDKVRLLDDLQPGTPVKVTFDIRGREYNGRYFNNLQAWRIEPQGEGATAPTEDDELPPLPDGPPSDFEEIDGNMPF